MPVLVISYLGWIGPYPKVKVPYNLSNKYPIIFEQLDSSNEVKIRVYVDKFYNNKGDIIKEYRQLFVLDLEKSGFNYYIDFTRFHTDDGIPMYSIVDALLINFVIKDLRGKEKEIPIFPNELIVEKDFWLAEEVSRLVDTEMRLLEDIGKDIEVVGLLYVTELNNVAVDLIEGLTRFYRSDYEGSIKFFRKVVEGLRNYVKANKLEGIGENRQESLRAYLSKAYQLISNFGEHSGTQGSMPEARLSKDIAVSSCRYIATYLKRE